MPWPSQSTYVGSRFHCRGVGDREITILGYYRDPIRSTKKRVVITPGIRWLCLSIIVQLPWCKREWALPFLTVALLSPKTSAKLGKRHHTTVQRTAQLICLVRRWLPDREIVVVGDGAYAAVPLIQCCQRFCRVTLVSRLLWNARLFDEPTPQPKSKRGPKPKRGLGNYTINLNIKIRMEI